MSDERTPDERLADAAANVKPFDDPAASTEQTPIEDALPAVTAPVFPWEIVFNNSAAFYQQTVGGGMKVKFCPLIQSGDNLIPTLPGVVVEFDAAAWQRFKEAVAGDGKPPSPIETVRTMPGHLLNGDAT